MPYQYPVAFRVFIGPADMFHVRNGAYAPHGSDEGAIYSSSMKNAYFGWTDATSASAVDMAGLFLHRFPWLAERGRGRDWAYAGWLHELTGLFLRYPSLLPVVQEEYMDKGPLELVNIPLSSGDDETAPKGFPLPPPGELREDIRS